LFDAVEYRVMLNNSQVLGLGQELLIGINTWTKSCSGIHLAHLLCHLACGYEVVSEKDF